MRTRGLFFVVAGLLFLFAAFGGFVYFGGYNIAADERHWALTERLLEGIRMRSIEARARDVGEPPNLENPKAVLLGAGQYAEMCAQCHLAPGKKESPLRDGLYPRPPDLTRQKVQPRAAFWVIKHGIKMTAMPAWGASHDDATLWGLVAFLQKLPVLDEKTYAKMVERAPRDEAMQKMPGMHGDPGPHGHGK